MTFVFVIILCCSTLPLIGECVLLLCNCVTFNVSCLFLCQVERKTLTQSIIPMIPLVPMIICIPVH